METPLDQEMHIRLPSEVIAAVNEAVEKHADRYENPSHFARCAIIRLVRLHEADLI